jgi:hypothetical protein
VKSPAFARELTALIEVDLRELGKQRFKDVVDVRMVHALVDRADAILAAEALSAVAIKLRGATRQQLRKTKRSLRDILGEQFLEDVDAAIESATNLTAQAEDFIAQLMERELVQSMMTDIVYTAIVSFNRRVNPLFGNLAMMAIDTQIKSFIRMFMPMLQRQATAFLIDRKNHALFADFARAAARLVLSEPLPQLFEIFNRGTDAEAKALLDRVARDPHVRRLAREGGRIAIDLVWREVSNRKVGSLVLLDDNVAWLAKALVTPLLAALQRSHIATFISREIEMAAAPAKPRRKRSD